MFSCCVRRLKITKHLFFLQLLFGWRASKVAVLKKRGHVSPKACYPGFQYTHPSMDGDSSSLKNLQGSPSSNGTANKQNWEILGLPQEVEVQGFCHTNFINQEEVVEHMKICSGANSETEVRKQICHNCQQAFETCEKIEKHFGIHIMR